MKTKINFYSNETAVFHDKEIPKVNSNLNSLVAMNLDCTLNEDRNYCLQVFLKECKYIKKVMIRNLMEDIEIFSNDSDESEAE